jgi:hypothetical protein
MLTKFIMQMKQDYFGDVYQPQYWLVKVEIWQVTLSRITVYQLFLRVQMLQAHMKLSRWLLQNKIQRSISFTCSL